MMHESSINSKNINAINVKQYCSYFPLYIFVVETTRATITYFHDNRPMHYVMQWLFLVSTAKLVHFYTLVLTTLTNTKSDKIKYI